MPDTGIAARTMPPQETAPQSTTLRQVVTGNRLRDGDWSTAVEDARHVAADSGETLLAASLAGPAPHPVVAPYLIDATLADGRLEPSGLRERIRAFGPTVSYR